jgi:hypothetical protein
MSIDQLRAAHARAIVFIAVAGDLSFPRVKGVRHFFRNFTALAVKSTCARRSKTQGAAPS